jgi:outer membrane protein TolC
MNAKFIASVCLAVGFGHPGFSQVLSLPDALQRSAGNYQSIRSKTALARAAEHHTAFQRQQLLPDLTFAAQQNFGTINAQHGPMYAYGGLASAATSMPLAEQNWHAAFGSLYFANVNWNVFTFGRLKRQVEVAEAGERTATADVAQEVFQHQVRVAAAYLNLLASQRIKYVQQKNLERAQVFFDMTDVRARSGLIPEVDASLAKAEVSNAKSLQIKAYDKELEYSRQLAVMLGETFRVYELDSIFSATLPATGGMVAEAATGLHPVLQWKQSMVEKSRHAEQLLHAYRMPSLSAFGVIQGRGSGFDWDYAQNTRAYSSAYLKGAGIDRGNYLLGLSLSWNLTDFFRRQQKVTEQRFTTRSLQHEYELAGNELNVQFSLAVTQLQNALDNHRETGVQLAAARQAYLQHTALYNNGLTTLVDYTQALYSLNRAEIDYEIAQNNVWQALLLRAASAGDLTVLLNANKK